MPGHATGAHMMCAHRSAACCPCKRTRRGPPRAHAAAPACTFFAHRALFSSLLCHYYCYVLHAWAVRAPSRAHRHRRAARARRGSRCMRMYVATAWRGARLGAAAAAAPRPQPASMRIGYIYNTWRTQPARASHTAGCMLHVACDASPARALPTIAYAVGCRPEYSVRSHIC